MACLFGIRPATFEKRVSDMIKTISDFVFNRFVTNYAGWYTLDRLIADNTDLSTTG